MSSYIVVLCFGFKYLPVMTVSSPPSFLSLISQAALPHHPTIRWADFISGRMWRNIKFGLSSLALIFVITPLHQLCSLCVLFARLGHLFSEPEISSKCHMLSKSSDPAGWQVLT